MKKFFVFLYFVMIVSAFVQAEVKVSASAGAGSTFVQSNSSGEGSEFGGAYFFADVSAGNDYASAGGKIYYRLSSAQQPSDLGQKVELKKAYVKVRPVGSEIFEIAAGKLYNYYLPGNYFGLGEFYTGASRWGKTGLGVKSKIGGFEFGAALPLTESSVKFTSDWAANISLLYDFADISTKTGATLLYDRSLQTDGNYKDDLSSTISLYYTPKFQGFVKKFSLALSLSFNAEPYVANLTFKNISNYNNANLKKSHFASVNLKSNFGPVAFVFEGEAGHSVNGSMIPLYAGIQTDIPLAGGFSFRPKAFYYAGLDSEVSDNNRQTFELYPRFWLNINNWSASAGCDLLYKQANKKEWNFQWKIPLFLEYKF